MALNVESDPPVATRLEIGPRDEQQDDACAHCHEDGSWVIAICDGLGGHARGADAAIAAIDAIPTRIYGPEQMIEAFQAANRAVWNLIPADEHRKRRFSEPYPGRNEPLTTIVVAAWTPETGFRAAWLGDSVLFTVPLQSGAAGWHSEPHGSWDSPIVDRSLGWAEPIPERFITHVDADTMRDCNRHIDGDGLLVIAATDGLFDPIRLGEYGRGGRFASNPADNSIGFAVPEQARSSAGAAADALMETATAHGLSDNAGVVVALARRQSS